MKVLVRLCADLGVDFDQRFTLSQNLASRVVQICRRVGTSWLDETDTPIPAMLADPVLQQFNWSVVNDFQQSLHYLYDKNLLSSKRILRMNELQQLFATVDGESSPVAKRLETLLRKGGDSCSSCIPHGVQTWTEALDSMPVWQDPSKSFVWFRDALETAITVPPQRSQKSSLCYMQAVAMLVTYLKRKAGKDGKQINMIQWMRESFGRKELRRHIFDGLGGESKDILERFLKSEIAFKAEDVSCIDSSVLKEFGPALLSRFHVYEHFQTKGKISFMEEDRKNFGEFKGFHSMLLIGVRSEIGSDGAVKKIFLLQNWWEDKQFVECSDRYLRLCRAEAVFVTEPDAFIDTLPTVNGIYAEALGIDRQERFEPESGAVVVTSNSFS